MSATSDEVKGGRMTRESSIGSESSADDLNLPPGRMNALKGTLRLNHVILPKKSESRSRSKSPSITYRSNTTDNSSMSSLEEDMLTDRAGLEELEVKLHNSREFVNLTPVNERMTEDTLEDVHAFSDVQRSSNASRANSISVQGEAPLQPLDECDEEDYSDLEADDSHPAVILTNMENLTINARPSTTAGATTNSSLLGEAPSAPTA